MTTSKPIAPLDAVIVGAGFAGLYMLHRLRQQGFSARILEAGSGAGGTWFWNRYPGARCDIESMEYSYKFSAALAQEWDWSERYATQPELMRYLNHVIARFNLGEHMVYDTRVASAHFDETTGLWALTSTAGDTTIARHCIMATGCLSAANMPEFPGRESYTGATYHTGKWPHEGVDFTGKTVAIIGTGSSSVQSIPFIAQEAKHLYVLQRTASYSVPAHNTPLDAAMRDATKTNYDALRARGLAQPLAFDIHLNDKAASELTPEQIQAEMDRRWALGGLPIYGAFADLLTNAQTNQLAAEYVRGKIRTVVKDAAVAELLAPKGMLGCKRICVDTGYYETFNRENVTLIDVSQQGIEEITPTGLRAAGQTLTVDAIIYATGFDAMTGSLERIDIRGRGGKTLKEKWSAGPITYLGLMSAGFPNFFTISGPGSPSVLTNMVMSIEQHVDFIAECLAHLRAQDLQHIEPQPGAEQTWVGHVDAVASATLLYSCNSWYLGANVPGKPRVFMPYIGFPAYADQCREVVAQGYAGFHLSAA